MRYCGGKFRLAKKIIDLIHKECDPADFPTFIEPFCGAINVSIEANQYYNCYCSDYNEDVILLWKHCELGEYRDIKEITKEEYLDYKNSKTHSWMRAIAGCGFSFRGIWFGVYDDVKRTVNKTSGCTEAVNNGINKKIKGISGIKFNHSSYLTLNKQTMDLLIKGNCVVYCDPPYANTAQPYSSNKFDSELFWKTIQEWSKLGNHIYVSEKSCPIPHELIYTWELTNRLNSKQVQDKLFYVL